MSVVSPPEPPRPDGLEALIREARARQRRRRLISAAAVAVIAAASLSAWAAVPGLGSGSSSHDRSADVAASRGIDDAGRVPIVEVGTSGGVTWAINGLNMWLTTNGGRTWRASAPQHVRDMGDVIARVEQVDFLDRRHAWLLAVDVSGGLHPAYARHAELDWTSDGGHNWHWTMPRGCCGDVSFATPRRGFFLGRSRRFQRRTAAGAGHRSRARRSAGASRPSSMRDMASRLPERVASSAPATAEDGGSPPTSLPGWASSRTWRDSVTGSSCPLSASAQPPPGWSSTSAMTAAPIGRRVRRRGGGSP